MSRRLICLLNLLALATPTGSAQTPITVVEIACDLHVIARLSDGSVVGWGTNRSGQLGVDAPTMITTPRRIPLPRKAISIATSTETSYAVLDDGTVMAWGRAYEGQLGPITLVGDDRGTREPTPRAVAGLDHVTRVVARGNGAVALLDDGDVKAWGDHGNGMYDADRNYRPDIFMPTTVQGVHNVIDISYDGSSALARTKDGRVFGWGRNGVGQLGLGKATDGVAAATEIPELRGAKSVVVAGASVAVKADGTVWAWGSNEQGGLASGRVANTMDPPVLEPARVAGIANAIEVKRGSSGRHIIVRLANDTLIGWGNSDWGQLGAGVIGQHQPSPKPIRLSSVSAYWLGGNYTFVKTADGSLWFFGERDGIRPILGPATQNQALPVKLPLEKVLGAR